MSSADRAHENYNQQSHQVQHPSTRWFHLANTGGDRRCLELLSVRHAATCQCWCSPPSLADRGQVPVVILLYGHCDLCCRVKPSQPSSICEVRNSCELWMLTSNGDRSEHLARSLRSFYDPLGPQMTLHKSREKYTRIPVGKKRLSSSSSSTKVRSSGPMAAVRVFQLHHARKRAGTVNDQ